MIDKKIQDLTGRQLNYAFASAVFRNIKQMASLWSFGEDDGGFILRCTEEMHPIRHGEFNPQSGYDDVWDLMREHTIEIQFQNFESCVFSCHPVIGRRGFPAKAGENSLPGVCRAITFKILGETVAIPEELCE